MWTVNAEKGSRTVYITDGHVELKLEARMTKEDKIQYAECLAYRLNGFDGLVSRVKELEGVVHHGNTF